MYNTALPPGKMLKTLLDFCASAISQQVNASWILIDVKIPGWYSIYSNTYRIPDAYVYIMVDSSSICIGY